MALRNLPAGGFCSQNFARRRVGSRAYDLRRRWPGRHAGAGANREVASRRSGVPATGAAGQDRLLDRVEPGQRFETIAAIYSNRQRPRRKRLLKTAIACRYGQNTKEVLGTMDVRLHVGVVSPILVQINSSAPG